MVVQRGQGGDHRGWVSHGPMRLDGPTNPEVLRETSRNPASIDSSRPHLLSGNYNGSHN